MILGLVIGSITSAINHPFYDGRKLMVVEKTDTAAARSPRRNAAVSEAA